ncbi:hypothetical protein ACFFRR_005041 [Megaselia abdita]
MTELCRICLKDCPNSFTLSRNVTLNPTKSSDVIQTSFREVFSFCTNLESDEKLTQFFCQSCFENILKAYQTIKTAQESHKLLCRVVNSIKGPSKDAATEIYNFEPQPKTQEAERITVTPTHFTSANQPNAKSFNEKIKCTICKDTIPKKYADMHFRKYHNNQVINISKAISLKEFESHPSPSTSLTINESSQDFFIKTEITEAEDNFEISTEDKIFSLLQDLKEDLELVKNKVFDCKMEFPPDISIVDNSIFPLATITDLEAIEEKISNDSQFKMELVTFIKIIQQFLKLKFSASTIQKYGWQDRDRLPSKYR